MEFASISELMFIRNRDVIFDVNQQVGRIFSNYRVHSCSSSIKVKSEHLKLAQKKYLIKEGLFGN